MAKFKNETGKGEILPVIVVGALVLMGIGAIDISLLPPLGIVLLAIVQVFAAKKGGKANLWKPAVVSAVFITLVTFATWAAQLPATETFYWVGYYLVAIIVSVPVLKAFAFTMGEAV